MATPHYKNQYKNQSKSLMRLTELNTITLLPPNSHGDRAGGYHSPVEQSYQ